MITASGGVRAPPLFLAFRHWRAGMGLTGKGIKALGSRVEEVMDDYFAGVVSIAGGAPIAASCSGGRETDDWDQDGLQVMRRERVVRVAKALLPVAPALETRLTWTPEGGAAVELRVRAVPERVQESRHLIRCHEV